MPQRRENRRFAIPDSPIGRREFLRLMGASIALAGAAGCTVSPPVEQIIPYVRRPQNITAGEPLFYATATTLGGYALGILVESHEGRPTKVEGNPLHPASLGATDAYAQASVLSLYDPDRSKDVLNYGQISTQDNFLSDLRAQLAAQKQTGGAGLRFLTETVTSPTLAAQIADLLKVFPSAVWHQYEPVNRDNEREGAVLAFGSDVETIYRFDKADVILSLDADFLLESSGHVRYARDFITRRRVRDGNQNLSRLYVVEATPTITGSVADHRLPMRSSDIETFCRELAGAVQNSGSGVSISGTLPAIANDLASHRGSSLIIAGPGQPPAVHAYAHSLNAALGNVGQTFYYIDPVAANSANQLQSLNSFVADLDAGKVETLIILGGNPAYCAPADLHFAESVQKAKWTAHLGLYNDETASLCKWHIPATHELESWSDARAYDGTVSIIQPLIAPLFNGVSPHELLEAMTGTSGRSAYEIVRQMWTAKRAGAELPTSLRQPNPSAPTAGVATDVASEWEQILRDGIVPNTAFAPKSVAARTGAFDSIANAPAQPTSGSIEFVFRPDPSVYDGRFANNGWLQELPKPLTKLTWDNAALMSPATAERLGITNEKAGTGGSHGQIVVDTVELGFAGKAVRAPAFIVPGHADDSVTVYLGYGRERAGQVGSGMGFNAYSLRTSTAMWFGQGLQVSKTSEQYSLACTQHHADMEGRELVRFASLADYKQNPNFAKREADLPEDQISLYPPWDYSGHAWGMVVDTGSCIGCNACIAACQAENNIPVVGKPEVLRAREMHWLRIDRYYEGGKTLHEPMLCQQCENAPCELVCPVEATTHSSEGLNEMTYNRCVGTRYCSNNCPYKVRRFNFFGYADFETPLVQLQRNPEVTVRSRGVMEKCTYCVQRIQYAKIKAETENRPLQDGEIVTACQQACPTEAIVFGDINDPNSRVSQLKREPTNYGVLAELNTRPRTTYLATVRNPNPEIKT
jgi:molybdopterin-containing oxidoreductase family iron-sulfur binding subunit